MLNPAVNGPPEPQVPAEVQVPLRQVHVSRWRGPVQAGPEICRAGRGQRQGFSCSGHCDGAARPGTVPAPGLSQGGCGGRRHRASRTMRRWGNAP